MVSGAFPDPKRLPSAHDVAGDGEAKAFSWPLPQTRNARRSGYHIKKAEFVQSITPNRGEYLWNAKREALNLHVTKNFFAHPPKSAGTCCTSSVLVAQHILVILIHNRPLWW